jgi:hypothetical protein
MLTDIRNSITKLETAFSQFISFAFQRKEDEL